ncbi:MAG: DDE-type integrase/transposase/recombinase [Clostridiales bacterium]|nr:DDE-type integrase/transposase/recombinase [Clostridiales bacterium]
MDEKKKQDIALMRYTAIAPVVSGLQDDCASLNAYFREASEKGVTAPDGDIRHFAPGTIEKWYYLYRDGGLDALMPSSRADCGHPRVLDEELQETIRYYVEHFPRLSAAGIHRQLLDEGSITKGAVSEATVNRFVNTIRAEQASPQNRDRRRYERPHINEVWCGDSSVGPYLRTEDGSKHRVYIIALIDDASRLIVGADLFFNDNFVNLMSVMKSAVAKYGRPSVWHFDNGKNYRNRQMELLTARLGSTTYYDPPYSPQNKAKIERWFLSAKNGWVAALDMHDFHSLDELRGSFYVYVQRYNQTPHSSLKGQTPQERFFSEPDHIRRLSQEEIDTDFLLEVVRRVSADSVVVIDNVEYEVDYRFAKQRIRLRYSPDLKDIYVVEANGDLTPIRLLNKHENAYIKREKVYLSGGED